MKAVLAALLSGLLFGFGLALSGMTDPKTVLGFLDVFGRWNPALLFVMAVAVPVTFLGYRLAGRGLPSVGRIDPPLLLGAAIFGVGWGIAGYCPGPALASLAAGYAGVWIFVAAMLAGMALALMLKACLSDRAKPVDA